jgi:hypothetical protein
MFEHLSGETKDWMPTIIGGLFSLIALLITLMNKRSAEQRTTDRDHEKTQRSEIERLREVEIANEASHAQDLTVRFRNLMEGYENRIKDLSSELTTTKGDLKERDVRLLVCNNCETYKAHLRNRDASPAA